ncbi:MAG TPA: nucleotidyltransferase family protein [Gemmataceae bacterium]|nr:nucleotidyltransferase family protein [Gemmataceae bacterium]
MTTTTAQHDSLDALTLRFYRSVLDVLRQNGPPFLVGGAYALAHYTGVVRHTKDLDLFVRSADAGRALKALTAAGWRTEVVFSHWLAKAFGGADFIDVIYNSGNGLCPVDDGWFAHAVEAEVLGGPVRLCPPEEMLWQKAFIQERERFDGADVAHLIRACGQGLDWRRLVDRFGPHWPVLFSHLVLFRYIYPSENDCIPPAVLHQLNERWRAEATAPSTDAPCRGVLLSRMQYLPDLERDGFTDARLKPDGALSAEQIKVWTDAGFER